MNDTDFEGTLVLEKIAAIEKLEDFYTAVDSDNFSEALTIMRSAHIDEDTIATVMQKMREGE